MTVEPNQLNTPTTLNPPTASVESPTLDTQTEPVEPSDSDVSKEKEITEITEKLEKLAISQPSAARIKTLNATWKEFISSKNKSCKVNAVANAFINAINEFPNNTDIKDIALETLNQFNKKDLIKNSNMISVIRLLCQTVRNRNSQDLKENQDLKDKTNNILSKIQSLINDTYETYAFAIIYHFITTKDLESINPDLYESILDKCFGFQNILVEALSNIVKKDNYKDKLNLDFISKYMQKHKTEGENSTYSMIKDDIEEEEEEEIKNKIKEILLPNQDSEEIQNEITRIPTANPSPLVNPTTPKPSEAPVEPTQPAELIPSDGGNDSDMISPNPPLESDTLDTPDNTYQEYVYDKAGIDSFSVEKIEKMINEQMNKIKEINSDNVEEYKKNTINFLKIVDSNFEKIKNNPTLLNNICDYLTSILNKNNPILYLAIHNNEEGIRVFNNIFYKLSATVKEQSTGNEEMENFFYNYFKCCQYKLYKADKKEKKIALENVIKLKQLKHYTNMSYIDLNLINDFLYLGLWDFSKDQDKKLFDNFIKFALESNDMNDRCITCIIQAQTMGYELNEEINKKLIEVIQNVDNAFCLINSVESIINMKMIGFDIDKDNNILCELIKSLKDCAGGLLYDFSSITILTQKHAKVYKQIYEQTIKEFADAADDDDDYTSLKERYKLATRVNTENEDTLHKVEQTTFQQFWKQYKKIIDNLNTLKYIDSIQDNESLTLDKQTEFRNRLQELESNYKDIIDTYQDCRNIGNLSQDIRQLKEIFNANGENNDIEKIKASFREIVTDIITLGIDAYLICQEDTNDTEDSKPPYQSMHKLSSVIIHKNTYDAARFLCFLQNQYTHTKFLKKITNPQEYKNLRQIIRDNMELIDDKTAGDRAIDNTYITSYIKNFSYIQ